MSMGMNMAASSNKKLSLWSLTSLVVGSMIGAGIFSLPATFGRAAEASVRLSPGLLPAAGC